MDDVKILIKNSDEKLLSAKTLFENGFYGAYKTLFCAPKSKILKMHSIFNLPKIYDF